MIVSMPKFTETPSLKIIFDFVNESNYDFSNPM